MMYPEHDPAAAKRAAETARRRHSRQKQRARETAIEAAERRALEADRIRQHRHCRQAYETPAEAAARRDRVTKRARLKRQQKFNRETEEEAAARRRHHAEEVRRSRFCERLNANSNAKASFLATSGHDTNAECLKSRCDTLVHDIDKVSAPEVDDECKTVIPKVEIADPLALPDKVCSNDVATLLVSPSDVADDKEKMDDDRAGPVQSHVFFFVEM